jgi:hypothetical protein
MSLRPPHTATATPLIRKLEQLGPLSDQARRMLAELPLDTRPVPAGQDLVREGEHPAHCLLLLDGVAARYKLLGEARQIVAFHVPGDLVDLAGLLLGRTDHSIGAVTPVAVAAVPHATIPGLDRAQPAARPAAVAGHADRRGRVPRVGGQRRPTHALLAHCAPSLRAGGAPACGKSRAG